ncbi:MAG: winged helix-turn-helix transcriptional regulator [Thermoplasmatota archaeon]
MKATLAPPLLALEDCPVLAGPARTSYEKSVLAARDFTRTAAQFLEKKTPKEKAAWLMVSVSSSRPIFQPWSMEILYLIGVLGRARFSELHGLLGLSTRTLSDKLKTLKEEGLVERQVFDEQPVRIEYFLTAHGRETVVLAGPLFAHLNLQALEDAGRIPPSESLLDSADSPKTTSRAR